MIPDANNPAARLLNLIEKLKNLDRNQPTMKAWAAIFVVRADDTPELLERVGRVMRLPKVTRTALLAVPDTAQIYFEWLPSIESAFKAHRLNGPLNEFIGQINDQATNTLRFCSDRLSTQAPEPILETEPLTKLRRDAAELRTDLEKADIDPDLKKFALDHLKVIISALNDYELFGVGPIHRAANEAIGAGAVDRRTARRLYAIPVGKKLIRYVLETARLLATLHGVMQLPGDFQHRLQLEPPAAVEAAPGPLESHPDPTGAPLGDAAIEIAGRDDTKNGAS